MAKLILDTHATIFALGAPRRLGRGARAAMTRVEAGRDGAWIPAAAVAEIVLLQQLGRTEIGLSQVRAAMEAAPHLRFLPMDLRQLDEFAGLALIRDPFDRLILAAARAVGGKLVTKDHALAAAGLIEVIWA